MQINKIFNFRNYNLKQNSIQNNQQSPFKVKSNNLAPLAQDTVSFGASAKLNRALLEAFDNVAVCQKVYDNAKPASQYLHDVLYSALGDYLLDINEAPNDKHFITIQERIKSPSSIREKIADQIGQSVPKGKLYVNPQSDEDIREKIGDIIGARIILHDAKDGNGDKIAEALIKQAEAGNLIITEVKHYPPNKKYYPKGGQDVKSYFSQSVINRLKKFTPDDKKPSKPKDSGYTALHINVRLKNGKKWGSDYNGYGAEIQIVGRDVMQLKEIEDACYKLKHDKDLKNGHFAYRPFKEHFNNLYYVGEDKKPLEAFNEYTARAYAMQRIKKSSISTAKQCSLPTIEDCGMHGKVPAGLDFNVLQWVMNSCNDIYDIEQNYT